MKANELKPGTRKAEKILKARGLSYDDFYGQRKAKAKIIFDMLPNKTDVIYYAAECLADKKVLKARAVGHFGKMTIAQMEEDSLRRRIELGLPSK